MNQENNYDSQNENINNEESNSVERNNKRKNKTVFVIIGIVVLIIILLLLLSRCSGPQGMWPGYAGTTPVETYDPDFQLDVDDNAGDPTEVDLEKLQEELDNQVAESMMNISMNLNPVFKDGKSKGNLLILNDKINKHPQIVKITLKDSGTVIYESKAIPVGKTIEYAPLVEDLDKGVYDCLAHFYSINEKNGNVLGEARAEIKVYVES